MRSPAGPRSVPGLQLEEYSGGFESGRRENMRMTTSNRARTITTVAFCFALGATLAFMPPSGVWWNVVRWPFYLPIFLVGARYGPFSGLACGVAVAVFFIVVASKETGDSWRGLVATDVAVVGLLGGFSRVWPRPVQPYFMTGREPLPSGGRLPELEVGIDLNPLASIEIAAGLLAQDDTSAGHAGRACRHRPRRSANTSRPAFRACSSASEQPRNKTGKSKSRQLSRPRSKRSSSCSVDSASPSAKTSRPGVPPIQCNPGKIQNLLVWLAISAAESRFCGKSGGSSMPAPRRMASFSMWRVGATVLHSPGCKSIVRIAPQTARCRRLRRRPQVWW